MRLIKPWRLRTVRQHLSDDRSFMNDTEMLVSCCGPQADLDEVYNARITTLYNRTENNRSEHALYNNAPLSNVICKISNPRTR